jgi:YesN/AraC family two-component response regulator
MDGAKALKKLKKICPETKVVMLSAQSNIDIAMDAIKNKAHDYVSKGDNAYYKIKNIVRHIASDIEMNEKLKRQNKLFRLLNIGVLVCFITITLLLQNFTRAINLKSQALDGDKSMDGDHEIALVVDGDKSVDGDKNIGPTNGDMCTKVVMG